MQTFQHSQDQQLLQSSLNPSEGSLPPYKYLPAYYGGLEPIIESELSSQDNLRSSQERRAEFQFQSSFVQVSQRERSESERSLGAQEILLKKVSLLESELVKEQANNQVLSKEKYIKRQETKEKKMLHEDISVVSARMEELEDKLTQISTENIRLQILINNQKLTISELQSKNKLSPGQPAVAGTTTLFKADSAQSYSEDNSRIREQVSEQMRVFWKEHFERMQENMIERYESEKKQLIQQLSVKEQLNKQLQTSFDTERQTSADCQQELRNREVEVTQIQICLNELEMKLMELKTINDNQSEQLSRLNQIECEAGKVLQENTRLNSVIKELNRQNESSNKDNENEKEQLEIDQKALNSNWQNLLSIEQENVSRVREQWEYSESALTKELEEFKVLTKEMKQQINFIEQQITILEDDKEKLLVILSSKSDLEQVNEVLNKKNTQLELEITQLLSQNSFFNSNLESRIKEVVMWKDRHTQSVDECKRVNQEYQEYINKQSEEHAKELQDEKTKKNIQIEKMAQELNNVQSNLQQFQFQSTSQHGLEIEKQRNLISKLNEKLSSSQAEVASLQQCLIELEHHHQRKIWELNEEFSKKQSRLMEENKKKIDEIQANRVLLNVQLQQTELLNSQLHSALQVLQQEHHGIISKMIEKEREGNSLGFELQEGAELMETRKGVENNVAYQQSGVGKIQPEILKSKIGTYNKNGSYYSMPENLERRFNGSPYCPSLLQRSSASGQDPSRRSYPLFSQKTPLNEYRSSLKEQGFDNLRKLKEDHSQQNSLQRDLRHPLARQTPYQQQRRPLAEENMESKGDSRESERNYHAKLNGMVETQEKKDDRSLQSSGSREKDQKRAQEIISRSRGMKEDLEQKEQKEDLGDDKIKAVQTELSIHSLKRSQTKKTSNGEKTSKKIRRQPTPKSASQKSDQERRNDYQDLIEDDHLSHGERHQQQELGLEEQEQEDPSSDGDRYERGDDYGDEDHGDQVCQKDKLDDNEEWDKDF